MKNTMILQQFNRIVCWSLVLFIVSTMVWSQVIYAEPLYVALPGVTTYNQPVHRTGSIYSNGAYRYGYTRGWGYGRTGSYTHRSAGYVRSSAYRRGAAYYHRGSAHRVYHRR